MRRGQAGGRAGRRIAVLVGVAFLMGGALGAGGADAASSALDRLKAMYVRPDRIPFPPDNPYTPAKAALGAKLFEEPGLSAGRVLSCAGCHVPELGFEDGQRLGAGVSGVPLERHTPTLWNLAWGASFFWDGRAASLEEQARMPIESTAEMNQSMELVVSGLRADPAYRVAFAEAFPGDPEITAQKVLAALATFERTLVPQPTRFDRWVAGEEDALGIREKRGFVLFNGKARCATCHSGFNFTDQAFHDIGLPDGDLGRGPVIGVPEANHAFKTPTLIDIGDRAPYMHDGSLPDLDAVIDHYVDGIVRRPTVSPDLVPVELSEAEKADLIAFLHSLDAQAPIGADEVAARAGPPELPEAGLEPVATDRIVQRDLAFAPGRVRVTAGTTVRIENRDTRTHTVDVNDPRLAFSSGANRPGEDVAIVFPEPGTYTVVCSIHPTMRLRVEAE